MLQMKNMISEISRVAAVALLLIGLLTMGSTAVLAQKSEVIEATAMGTNSQLGENAEMRLTIYDYSTLEERQILVQAFQKGQNQGLVNALSKMRAVGHISLTGTIGYDVSYIRVIPTSTGRKIRFVTDRPISFVEAWADTQSQAFNLTGGEFDLNDQDKSKSTGVLFPAAQLVIDKQGKLQIDLNQNSWRLTDVLDWKGTSGVN